MSISTDSTEEMEGLDLHSTLRESTRRVEHMVYEVRVLLDCSGGYRSIT